MQPGQNTTLFGKPITVDMLTSAVERGGQFELALGEVAPELNEALGNFDHSGSQDDLLVIVKAARRAVQIIEKAKPNAPLRKPQSKTDEDIAWESHLLRGSFPGDEENGCDCSFCKGGLHGT